MQTKLDKADCMFLLSDENLNRFQQLIDKLDFFTLVLPVAKESYQRSIIIFDIWYLLSTKEMDRIANPENIMIYPYRKYILEIIKTMQIKRYIQLAMYENDQLTFICAIHIYKELDDFVSNKMLENEEVAPNFTELKKYSQKSLRPYYDLKYFEVENYPKQLAMLQNNVVGELQEIHQNFEETIHNTLEGALDEACSIYEAVFGLINDWGGRVP